MPVALGILSSLLIGLSDTLGRFAARRASSVTHVATAMAAGIATATAMSLLLRDELSTRDLTFGAISGLLVASALAVMYRGMADASAAVVSPLVATLGALVPLAWDVATGLRPSGTVWAGCGIAVLALALTTFDPHLGDRIRKGVIMGLGAGVLFGTSIVFAGETAESSGAWPVAAQRTAGFAAMVVLARRRSVPVLLPPHLRRVGVASGAVGTLGVVALVIGAQRGDLGVVSVAGSMFPAVVAVLSALFDDDSLRWWQMVGIAGAITGVAFIALGA